MNRRSIHVLAGEPTLLQPDMIKAQELVDILGLELKPVTAYWISPRCGVYNHNFLADVVDDDRIEIFARSLITDYARSPEPLLIIPTLVDQPENAVGDDANRWARILRRLESEIRRFDHDCMFHLYLLAISTHSNAAARLEHLLEWLSGLGLQAQIAERGVLHQHFESPQVNRLETNFHCWILASALSEKLNQKGVVISHPEKLALFLSEKLIGLAKLGIRPTLPPKGELLELLAESVITEPAPLTRRDAT